MPQELSFFGIFVPPELICVFAGFLTAYALSLLFNHWRISEFFYYPPLAYFALAIILTITYNQLVPF